MPESLSAMIMTAFKRALAVEHDTDALGKPVDICTLGQLLKAIDPTFSPHNYGEEKLKHLLQKFDSEIELKEDDSVDPSRYFATLSRVIPDEFSSSGAAASFSPTTYDNIKRFAYILPQRYEELAAMALPEKWYFGTQPKPGRQYELLENYLNYTFIRLLHEGKILESTSGALAAFNTGLVDEKYEPIFALFEPNKNNLQKWFLRSFCIRGEGAEGKRLVGEFAKLPEAADYFSQPQDFIYDLHANPPSIDWEHIIIENVDRIPLDFFNSLHIKDFSCKDCSKMSEEDLSGYITELRTAFYKDKRAYRIAIALFKGAVEDTLKKVRWNYKTAIPMYYPRTRKINLLLPLCLVSDDQVDVALVVERMGSGQYQAHTILQLEWAYQNARLICRPDSDWLSSSLIES
ncbi:MAG TPA: DUF3825 domain-containing protein [Candidatus Avidesulfovibrio excrementigallinarum]|nr:DUF3825 domain-containing protein [Candidatus Avidesulfovibrio excrementigallinarum]